MADNNELQLKLTAIDELTPVMIRAVAAMEQQTTALVATLDKISTGSDAAKDKTEGLNSGMVNLAAGLEVVKSAAELAEKAYEKLEAQFEKAIDEAENAEKANNRLAGALVATGNYTEENVKKTQEYAEAIKNQTGVSEENIKTMIAQGVQMGLSVEGAEKMELAARELAAATGKDLNEAFAMLSGTMAGQARGLSKILPQVKDLTQEQLKQGAAADLVTKAFSAQYQLYEQSYSVAVTKAKTAVDEVYKSIGLMIIQSPVVIKAIQAFADGATALVEGLGTLQAWIQANQPIIEQFGNAVLLVAAAFATYGVAALASWAVAAWAAATPTAILAGALAVLASPITLAIVAVVGLTAAFKQWPGLFDQITGAFKFVIGTVVDGLSVMLSYSAKFVAVFDKDLAASMQRAADSMAGWSDKLKTAAVDQVNLGTKINETGAIQLQAVDSTQKHTAALDANMVSASKAAAAQKNLAQSYAGIVIGTKQAQEALKGEVQQRDQDLKKFQDYLANKQRLAVSAATEQQNALKAVQAKEVGGGTGDESTKARLDNEIALETTHQAQLAALRKTGAITAAQYDEAMFDSKQKIDALEIQQEQRHQQALAAVYASSPAGYENQKKIDEENFDAKLTAQSEQLRRLGQNEDQIAQFQMASREQFQQQEFEQQKAHDAQMITLATQSAQQRAEALGDTPAAMQAKLQIEEQQFQLSLQTKLIHAQQEGATDAQIDALKQTAALDHANAMTQIQVDYYNREAERQQKSNNDWEAFQAQRNASIAQQGIVMGNLQAVTNSQYYKSEMTMLNNLSSLRTSKSKGQFEVGKDAAIAQAGIATFLGAIQAYTSLSSIPIVGPVLGAIAAAAAIAAGTNNIQQIKAQKFGGGQADSGMDSVPQHLDGKSFILSGGERVVQPTANKELTDFLASEKSDKQAGGGRSGGMTVNVTIQGGKDSADVIATAVIAKIRTLSERGAPIMNAKGIVNG